MDQNSTFAVAADPKLASPKKVNPMIFVVIVLLIATLISAGVSWLILSKGVANKSQTSETPATETPTSSTNDYNPFVQADSQINPFVADQAEGTTVNPFSESDSANPFDQFTADSTNTSKGSYQNPF